MDEITARFVVPDEEEPLKATYNVEDDDCEINPTFRIETSPTKISELEDDVGIASDTDLSALQLQVNLFQQAEANEMINIVDIMRRCTENMIDLTREGDINNDME